MRKINLNTEINKIDFGYNIDHHVQNLLEYHKITTLRELCMTSKSRLVKLEGLGKKSLYVIEQVLNAYNLKLGMTDNELKSYSSEADTKQKKTSRIITDSTIWEERRYEIAKDMVCANYSPNEAIEKAGELVELLRENGM